MSSRTTRPRLVEVVWEDSARTVDGWTDRAAAIAGNQPARVRTAGYLIAETPALLVCLSYDDVIDEVDECMSIPRSVVRRIRTLKP